MVQAAEPRYHCANDAVKIRLVTRVGDTGFEPVTSSV